MALLGTDQFDVPVKWRDSSNTSSCFTRWRLMSETNALFSSWQWWIESPRRSARGRFRTFTFCRLFRRGASSRDGGKWNCSALIRSQARVFPHHIIITFRFVLFTNDLAPTPEHVYALLYADDLKSSLQANLLSNCFMSPTERQTGLFLSATYKQAFIKHLRMLALWNSHIIIKFRFYSNFRLV